MLLLSIIDDRAKPQGSRTEYSCFMTRLALRMGVKQALKIDRDLSLGE